MPRPVLRNLRNILPAQYHPQLPHWRLARLQLAGLHLQRRRLLSHHHLWHLLTSFSFWLYLVYLPECLCGLEVYDTCHATFLQVCDRSTVGSRTMTWWSKVVLLSIGALITPSQYFRRMAWSKLETKSNFDVWYNAPYLEIHFKSIQVLLYLLVHVATREVLSLLWEHSTLILVSTDMCLHCPIYAVFNKDV